MYRSFLADAHKVNPHLRVIGLTATPYRMKSGYVCAPENILNHVCYEIGVRELIVQGYLCPLITKGGREDLDTDGLHVRAGEFMADEVEALMDQEQRVEAACTEISSHMHERNSCLVFTSSVKHAEHVAKVLERTCDTVATVFGDTPDTRRAETIAGFKTGRIKYLVNVNVLTHGFDAPNVDCVAILRPTMSPGLFSQIVGRGFRLYPGKENCLILDFGGNVLRHGPVDAIRIKEPGSNGRGEPPAKKCPECLSIIAAGYALCPDCGYEFPKPNRGMHDPYAGTAGVLSGQVTTTKYSVQETHFSIHIKRDAPEDAPKTMRVEYRIVWKYYQSEWLCFEHIGWARHKAESWWRQRSNAPMPVTAADAVAMAKAGALCETKEITVRSVVGERYDRIIGYELGEKPFYREPGWDEEEDAVIPIGAERDFDDVPF